MRSFEFQYLIIEVDLQTTFNFGNLFLYNRNTN